MTELATKTNDELKAMLDAKGTEYKAKDTKDTLIALLEADSEPVAEMEPAAEEEVKEPEVLKRTKTGRFPGRKAESLRANGKITLHQVDSGREGRAKWDYQIKVDGNHRETIEANYEAAKRRCRDLALETQKAFDVKQDYFRA